LPPQTFAASRLPIPMEGAFFMHAAEPLIEISRLYHAYEGSGSEPIDALRGVSLTVHPGEFVAVVGANGSGKTTLARHLNALLLPTRGEVRVAGLDTRQESARPAIRSQVAMVFQQPEDQIIATTVEDDVAFGPENLGLPVGEIEGQVRWALETVEMWGLRHRPPHLLSVGQQQRAAIAGALALRPRCLVLDEATAMLDPAGRREVLALLQRLHADGVTVVLITHHMAEAALAERLIVLSEGRVAFDGTPRRFFACPNHVTRLGLDLPPVADLAARMVRRWPDFPAGLFDLDQVADALASRNVQIEPLSFTDSSFASNGRPAVAAHDLHYTYLANTPLAVKALDGVSVEVHAGESMALLGATGSGKSTLLQHLAGLLEPQEGRVFVAGKDAHTRRTDRRFLREQVGILFQRPEEQLFETYVGDDVAFGPRRLGLDREAVRERVRRAMEAVGLPFLEYKDRFAQSLSGGERRKAALAGVLALCPKTLLLDEPTAGLDPQSRRDLLDTLRRLNQEEGLTLVIATHNMDDVTTLAGRVVVLEGGQVALRGSTRRVFARAERLRALGLDVPAAVAVMAALRERGLSLPAGALTLDEVEAAILGGAVPSSAREAEEVSV
jgi:energy-coupling factor transport system ATP-binding protein